MTKKWINFSNMHRSGKYKRFNLSKYFVVYSIGVFIVLTTLLGVVFVNHQKNLLIDYAKSSAHEFSHLLTHQIFNENLVKVLNSKTGIDVVANSEQYKNLDRIISSYVNEYSDIFKIKVFNKRGLTIYSTSPEDIGMINNHDKLAMALSGQISSELTRRMQPLTGESKESGITYAFDILKVHLPIYAKHEGKHKGTEVVGAFEVYKNVSAVFNEARRGGYIIFALFAAGMIALFLILQLIIKKADKIIKKQNSDIDVYNRELEAAQNVITKSIDEVIEHESFHVRFDNEKLLKCWEYKKCDKTDCPSYESQDLRCWQNAGTFCGGVVQGYFANKYGDCRKCDVFRHAFSGRINTIGESFNNMMTLLYNKQLQLKELNDRLNWLIDIDPLTQVGNRRSFQKRIENTHMVSIRYRRPYSIIICDIDNFKFYNDNYGHQKGDYALVTIAKNLKDNLRQTDEIFRWGGEEFVIILPEQNLSSALKVAEHLRVSVQALAVEHRQSEFQIITMSFGVSSSTTENIKHISWESILKDADDQLYKAKSKGKNRVYPLKAKDGEGSA